MRVAGSSAANTPAGDTAPTGLLLVDKPQGVTSHDVVGRVRAVLGTRRVGHAGTLDPMATGLLILATGRATKLLGHLALATKAYTATIRLGESTDTDDADGTVVERKDASTVTEDAIRAGIAALTGEIDQVPSSFSAIKVDGKRAYDLARGGQEVQLAARTVTISQFEITAPLRRSAGGGTLIDVDVRVDCSTGTYIRALARDLGSALGVGGHLTRLRRESIGRFAVADAAPVFPAGIFSRGEPRPSISDALRADVAGRVITVTAAVRTAFRCRTVTEAEAHDVGYGRSIAPAGIDGTYAALNEAGEFLALLSETATSEAGERAKPVFVFAAR